MRELSVGVNDAGQRLDRFLAKAVPGLPESLIGKYIRKKRVKLSGKPAKHDTRLSVGDTVQLYINDEFFANTESDTAQLTRISLSERDIVYEDENILLVNKQPGLLSHSDEAGDSDTLITRIQARAYRRGEWDPATENSFVPSLCNRIDRNTSGIVIAAKNAESLRILNEKIRDREIDKFYLCVITGSIEPRRGRLEGYIFKDAKLNRVYVSDRQTRGGKSAVTEYRTLKMREGLSLVECRLVTGRTHQIRAQFAAAGHPLLGDGKYGSERVNRNFGEKRQALCSYKLEFCFSTDAGVLEYLNHRQFELNQISFVEKYFNND